MANSEDEFFCLGIFELVDDVLPFTSSWSQDLVQDTEMELRIAGDFLYGLTRVGNLPSLLRIRRFTEDIAAGVGDLELWEGVFDSQVRLEFEFKLLQILGINSLDLHVLKLSVILDHLIFI